MNNNQLKRCGRGIRTACLLLAFVLLASGQMPAQAASARFTDLEGHYARGEIFELFEQGIYHGFLTAEDEKFQPSLAITRAEFLAVTLNAMGFTQGYAYAQRRVPFADYDAVPAVYKPYIAEGYSRGILLGAKAADGRLYSNWDKSITRQEASTILGRVLNLRADGAPPCADAEAVSDWARPYVAGMYRESYLAGYPDGLFRPQNPINRADASHIVHNLLSSGALVPQELLIYAGSSVPGYQNGARLQSALTLPHGLTLLPDGSLLVADSGSNLLRRVTDSAVSTLAGSTAVLDANGLPQGGLLDRVAPGKARLNTPRYIAAAPNGDIYFTEKGNNVVRLLRARDSMVYTFSGTGKAGYTNGAREKTQFNLPSGIAVRGDSVYVADTLNNCIRVLDKNGGSATYAGTPGETGGYRDGAASSAKFNEPTDLQFGPDGALYVLDSGNSMLRKIANGAVTTVAGAETAIDDETGCMAGGFRDGLAAEALFSAPTGLYVTAAGAVYIADTNNHLVRKLENGYVTTVAGNRRAGHTTGPALLSSLNRPADVLWYDNSLYITDSLNNCVMIVKGAAK